MRRHREPALFVLLPALAAWALAGCGDDSVSPPPGGSGGTDLTEPTAVIAAHAQALSDRDLEAYGALLVAPAGGRGDNPEFRYYPQSEDLADFPWLQGNDYWGRTEELAIIGHMFDPEFVSSETGESIETIQAQIQFLGSEPVGAEIEVLANFSITVLWAANSGLAANGQFVFRLATDDDGYLRIREIRELSGLGRAPHPAAEEASWGTIKALYRD